VRRRGSHIFYTMGSQVTVRLPALCTGRDLPACSMVPQATTLPRDPNEQKTKDKACSLRYTGRFRPLSTGGM
jgi:hypothetical protein